MLTYLKRTGELLAVTFVGGAVASLAEGGWSLSRAGLMAAVTAGVMAVYGVIMKGRGAEDRPTLH
jgi:hypothetical protein